MKRIRFSFRGFILVATILSVAGLSEFATPSVAQAKAPAPGSVIQSQETDTAGVVAEIYECKRKEGVLSIKVRFRNTGSAGAYHNVYSGRNFDAFYVTAASKKYFILRDAEKVPLSVPTNPVGDLDVSIKPGGTFIWWAKYPAPPAEVKKINFTMPHVAPFDDVPISDQ